jgi:hypothetical protein
MVVTNETDWDTFACEHLCQGTWIGVELKEMVSVVQKQVKVAEEVFA